MNCHRGGVGGRLLFDLGFKACPCVKFLGQICNLGGGRTDLGV